MTAAKSAIRILLIIGGIAALFFGYTNSSVIVMGLGVFLVIGAMLAK